MTLNIKDKNKVKKNKNISYLKDLLFFLELKF